MTRLMHLSDLHFGAEVPEAVAALVSAAAELRPDGVVIGGDFTMRARRREWAGARAFIGELEGLGLPVLAIPGNHDIPGFNHPWHRLFHPFQRYKRAIDADLEPVGRFGEIEVAGLNTARRFGAWAYDWSTGSVSVAQCVSLPFRFGQETPLRAVVIHHPLLAPREGRRRLLRRDGLLLAALEKSRVDLLLAGHFHQSHVGLLKLPLGTREIVLSHASTACSRRVKGESMGFHVIAADAGRMEVERWDHDESDGRFHHRKTHGFARRAESWTEENARGAEEDGGVQGST